MEYNRISSIVCGLPMLALVALLPACTKKAPENTAATAVVDTTQADSSKASNTPPTASDDNEVVKTHRGIDISHYQGDFETEITPEDSLTFIICKATQGTGSVDPDFKNNWETATKKGLIRGAYHFYVVGDDPVQQAEHFWNTIGTLQPTDIAPVVDIEQASFPKKNVPTNAQLQADMLSFLNHIGQKCSCTPMIYSNASIIDPNLNNPEFAKYPLWVAEYGVPKPRLPKIYEKIGYKIWQKSYNYDLNATLVDYDVYVGKKSDLYHR